MCTVAISSKTKQLCTTLLKFFEFLNTLVITIIVCLFFRLTCFSNCFFEPGLRVCAVHWFKASRLRQNWQCSHHNNICNARLTVLLTVHLLESLFNTTFIFSKWFGLTNKTKGAQMIKFSIEVWFWKEWEGWWQHHIENLPTPWDLQQGQTCTVEKLLMISYYKSFEFL